MLLHVLSQKMAWIELSVVVCIRNTTYTQVQGGDVEA